MAVLYYYLTNGSAVIDLGDFIEGITFQQDINPDEDLVLGVVSSASISFKVKDGEMFDVNEAWALYYQGTLLGYYYPSEKEIGTYDTWTITCYDCVTKLDKIADSWLNSLSYPITLNSFTQQLCGQCGLSVDDLPYRSDYLVENNFMTQNVTYRTVLSYVAQIANVDFIADKTTKDKIIPIRFSEIASDTIGGDKYYTLDCSREAIYPIDKVQIQSTLDDVGYTAGSGSNCYTITGNPLLFTRGSSVQELAETLLNELDITTVYSVSLTGSNVDFLPFNVGERLTANGKDFIILSKTISPSGTTLDGKVNIERETPSESNSAITMLNNKMNELTITVDQTESKLTSIEGQMEDEIATLTTQITDVKQTADSLNIEVSNVKSAVDANTGDITELESKQAELTITAEGLTSKVTEASNKADEASTKASTVQQTVDSLTYTDDKGQIKISGGNVYLTGQITWNDLTTDVQDEISNAGYSKSQIKTIINDQLVSSPNIAGGKFWDLDQSLYLKIVPDSSGLGGTFTYHDGTANDQDVMTVWYSGDNWATLGFLSKDYIQVGGSTLYALGNWDFSDATVSGLSGGSSGGTAEAVFG